VNVLEIDGLVKSYNTGVRALDGLNFSVGQGSIFGFIGLNGAGKTTTIRIIAGLTRGDAGAVRLFGSDIGGSDDRYKRRIGFVLDEPLYFDWMSSERYLRFVGRMEGLTAAESGWRTDELLEFFDLSSKGEDPIATFSTGMKKKVSLAAAIIHNPELLILDEPLEGIDALAAATIKETLLLMVSRGTTVMITSHILETVERLCTEIGILHQGRMLLQCDSNELRRRAALSAGEGGASSLESLFIQLVSGPSRKPGLAFLSHGDTSENHRAPR